MSTLTLKQVPPALLERLREEALRQRRSVNQQAIHLLEEALARPEGHFATDLQAFYQRVGPLDDGLAEALEGLRDPSPGRDRSLGDGALTDAADADAPPPPAPRRRRGRK